jgi:hypothetical protein
MAEMQAVEQALQQLIAQRLAADPGLVKEFHGLASTAGGDVAKQWLDYSLQKSTAQPDGSVPRQGEPAAATATAQTSEKTADDLPDEIGVLLSGPEIEAILYGNIPAELAAAMEAADWEIESLEPVD